MYRKYIASGVERMLASHGRRSTVFLFRSPDRCRIHAVWRGRVLLVQKPHSAAPLLGWGLAAEYAPRPLPPQTKIDLMLLWHAYALAFFLVFSSMMRSERPYILSSASMLASTVVTACARWGEHVWRTCVSVCTVKMALSYLRPHRLAGGQCFVQLQWLC